jgi:hypothetical protein
LDVGLKTIQLATVLA